MQQTVTTELLGEHPKLHLIEIEGIKDAQVSNSWIRSGDGLIGFGEWKSTVVRGENRFSDARKWWQEQLASLKIQNNVHGVGTGPILFSSFSFDEAMESRLVIPKIIVGQKGGKSWITWIGDEAQPALKEMTAIPKSGAIEFSQGSLSDTELKARVAIAINKIKNS